MAWKSFAERSQEVRDAISSYLQGKPSGVAPEEYYNLNDLGLIDDASVMEFLQVGKRINQDGEAEISLSRAVESRDLDLKEDELYSVKTLRWLQQNAHSPEDKILAKIRYRKILFELWRKRMADTGETWYPPLRDDLWERYKLMANDPDFF